MSTSFWHLFLMNLKLLYRNSTGLFFTLVMPLVVYVALSILPIGSLSGTGVKYSNFILPGIIAMTIMQSGIYTLAYWLIDLKTRGVIKRFLVTPISQKELVLSLVLSRLLVILLQIVILTAAGMLFFHASFSGNPLWALVIGLLGGLIFLFMGFMVSMLADSYEAAAPITSVIGLPMTFLGNIFFPTDSLPKVLRGISQALPISYMADALRKAYLSHPSFSDLSKDILVLFAWLIAMLAIVLWRFRLEE